MPNVLPLAHNRDMLLTLRLDDITPEMDRERFDRFLSLMEDYGILPLLGIVPDVRDPSLMADGKKADGAARARFFEEMVRLKEQGFAIAMHGLDHVYTTKESGLFPLNKDSEFAGLPYEEQRDRLQKGKNILKEAGLDTDLFMAPSHTFDEATIRALSDTGFTKITDGFGAAPYTFRGMTFYPIAYSRQKAIADTLPRLAHPVCTLAMGGVTTLVVHTNTLTDKDFAEYEKLFQTKAFIPYTTWDYLPVKKLSRLKHALHYRMADSKRRIVQGR